LIEYIDTVQVNNIKQQSTSAYKHDYIKISKIDMPPDLQR